MHANNRHVDSSPPDRNGYLRESIFSRAGALLLPEFASVLVLANASVWCHDIIKDVQETRDCVRSTRTASKWLRANERTLESPSNRFNPRRAVDESTELMNRCKDILAALPKDLCSLAQEKVRYSLSGDHKLYVAQLRGQTSQLFRNPAGFE